MLSGDSYHWLIPVVCLAFSEFFVGLGLKIVYRKELVVLGALINFSSLCTCIVPTIYKYLN